MPLTNTAASYGSVARTFHWLIALLILTVLPVGWVASELSERITDPQIATGEATLAWAKLLFSLHKTLGVTIFFTALARILWALSQTRPGLLNGDRRAEAWLAETVHWLLYGSLVLVPLSGWVHHAATSGFAPIWWPFGQTLPFVPTSEAWADISGALHYLLQWVLVGALALHVAGALKHHLIDRDATLRRMLPGGGAAQPTARQPGHALPVLSALAVWAAVLGIGAGLGWFERAADATGQVRATAASDWQVQTGSLDIAISQMGSEVTGGFADWTADIAYDETADATGRHGAVEVTVSITSLSLGSVGEQAMGPDFFAAETWPTARFSADLVAREGELLADGTLRIRDNTVPVTLPVTLSIEGDLAHASGALRVDRRDFGIGTGTTDPDTLGFEVGISFDLTAERR